MQIVFTEEPRCNLFNLLWWSNLYSLGMGTFRYLPPNCSLDGNVPTSQMRHLNERTLKVQHVFALPYFEGPFVSCALRNDLRTGRLEKEEWVR